MKLCKLMLLLLAMSTIVFVSCKKETFDSGVDTLFTSEFKLNEIPIDQVGLNADDKEDELINQSLFQVAESLKTFATDQQFVDFTVRKAQANNGLVYFEEVFQAFPQMEAALSTDALANENNPFEHTGHLYKTALFVPNFEVAKTAQLPIISPGIELYDDLKNNNPDIIFAWDVNEAGETVAINIGEKEAMKTARPLLALTLELCKQQSNGLTREDLTNGSLPNANDPTLVATRAVSSFSTYEFRINHRFESSGSSEFWCQSNRIDPNGTLHWINSSNGGRYHVADVKKNDIGKQLKKWKNFAGNWTPYGANAVFYNTYERDWYSSFKALGSGDANGSTVNYSGKRKYHNEWYSFDPANTLTGHNPNFQLIVNNWTQRYQFDDNRGYWNIWRIDN